MSKPSVRPISLRRAVTFAYLIAGNESSKQIQFFGARCNLAKALLLAINGGRCENTGTVMVKNIQFGTPQYGQVWFW
mgnify:CR=1 FL=1